jgi:phytoene/squalene synthetase
MHSLTALARTHDYDRYLCTLFAPACARPALWAALVLGHELLRIPSVTSEEMVGLVRLKWWQEQITSVYQGNAAALDQPSLQAVAPVLQAGQVPLTQYNSLIDTLAVHLGAESKMAPTRQVLGEFYRILAHAAGKGQDVECYAQIGEQQATIAMIRALVARDWDFGRVATLLESLAVSRPLPKQTDPLLRRLVRLNQLWGKRITLAYRQSNPSILHRIPAVALRLSLA